MSLEFLQRPNSDAAPALVADPTLKPISQPESNTAPVPVSEPTPASVEEPVTTQEPSPSQEPDIASEEPAPEAPATMSYASVAASGPKQSDEEVSHHQLACFSRGFANAVCRSEFRTTLHR